MKSGFGQPEPLRIRMPLPVRFAVEHVIVFPRPPAAHLVVKFVAINPVRKGKKRFTTHQTGDA